MSHLPKSVTVHPLVLLSTVDHYTRVNNTKKRVVGVLLGTRFAGSVDVTNSYAVPFEEDRKSPLIWFLDHNYHENMHAMFKKVNAKEKIVGWYSTGPKIRPADLEIHERFRKYTANPIFVIIDVKPKDDLEIPTQAYISEPDINDTKAKRTFVHIPSEIGAYDAEEVGVEHLLRDIRDTSVGSLTDQVAAKLASLKGLKNRMETMSKYLDNVVSGKFPMNHQIIYLMQDMFNLCPNLQIEELVKSLKVNTNDNMLVIYIASLIRSITALHDLINNKLKNRTLEQKKRASEREVNAKSKEQSKKVEGKEASSPKETTEEKKK